MGMVNKGRKISRKEALNILVKVLERAEEERIKNQFYSGQKVVYKGNTYDFGYYVYNDLADDRAVIYFEGERSMQGSISVLTKDLKAKVKDELDVTESILQGRGVTKSGKKPDYAELKFPTDEWIFMEAVAAMDELVREHSYIPNNFLIQDTIRRMMAKVRDIKDESDRAIADREALLQFQREGLPPLAPDTRPTPKVLTDEGLVKAIDDYMDRRNLKPEVRVEVKRAVLQFSVDWEKAARDAMQDEVREAFEAGWFARDNRAGVRKFEGKKTCNELLREDIETYLTNEKEEKNERD